MTAQPKPTAADVLAQHAVTPKPFPAHPVVCKCRYSEFPTRVPHWQHQADMLAAVFPLAGRARRAGAPGLGRGPAERAQPVAGSLPPCPR